MALDKKMLEKIEMPDLTKARIPKIKLVDEFKSFALKGNVVDMAIGIIVGAGFGKIVSSLVNDVIMPPLGVLIGGVSFKDLSVVIKEATATTPAVTLNYGNFIQVVFDFLIVAFAIFMLIKGMAVMRKRLEFKKGEEPKAKLTKEEELLTEIRDLLKKGSEK